MTESRHDNPDTEPLERLYRRAADAEPSGRLDDAVLGRARKAASRPRRLGLQHPGAWGLGLAAAASLVLAVGLFFQQGGQPERTAPVMEQFRADGDLRDADTAAGPAAPAVKAETPAGEGAGLRESKELDRTEVGAARARQQPKSEEFEGRALSKDEAGAEQRVAAPLPAEEAEQLSPEAWLEQIGKLVDQKRLDEAREQLRGFREAHPSATVPVKIREALATDSG